MPKSSSIYRTNDNTAQLLLLANGVEVFDENTSIKNNNFNLTNENINVVNSIANYSDTLALLIKSLLPDIQGCELVKFGLLLGLLNGTDLGNRKDKYRPKPNIHILLIGDPGMGKSTMLQYILK